MSIEWLKQYLLWGLFFFAIGIVLLFVYCCVTYCVKKIRKKRNGKD